MIVNPNQPGCAFPSKHVAGVGVMFYVLAATRSLLRARGRDEASLPNLASLLDLVAQTALEPQDGLGVHVERQPVQAVADINVGHVSQRDELGKTDALGRRPIDHGRDHGTRLRYQRDAARQGHGPTLIEAYTYRMGAHTTSDDPTKYRVSAEVEVWKHRDPIERFKRWLLTTGRADAAFFDAIDDESDTLGTSVRERCLSMPEPPGTDMFDHVYATPHPVMERERAEFVAYQASFEEAQA